MRSITPLLVLFALVGTTLSAGGASWAQEAPDVAREGGVEFVPGEIVVDADPKGEGDVRVVQVPAADTLTELRREAREAAGPGVVAAPNYVYKVGPTPVDVEDPGPPESEPATDRVTAQALDNLPNDPFFANTGDTTPPNDQQVNLREALFVAAWRSNHGSKAEVGVVDTGFDQDHPELAPKILAQYDFVEEDAVAQEAPNDTHGTGVAGIAAGVTDNSAGIASAGWNAKINFARACEPDRCSSEDTAPAIDFVRQQGSEVINLSFAGPAQDAVLQAAVQRALDANIVVVAAAGNTGGTQSGPEVLYPAGYAGVLGVGSTNAKGTSTPADATRSAFSTYGPQVDVVVSSEVDDQRDIVVTCERDVATTGYCRQQGTSFSSPQVAGLVALVTSETPSLTAAQIANRVQNQAADLGPAGRDDEYGRGIINAKCSVNPGANGC